MKSIRSVFIKAICLLVLIAISNSFSLTEAQPLPNYSVITDPGDIRFVNAQDGMLVFELDLKSLPEKGSMLKIKDESGNLLFEQRIRTETYHVRCKVERSNFSKIVFEVSDKKILLNKSFSINTWMEERIEVAKL